MELRFGDIQWMTPATQMGIDAVYEYLRVRGVTVEDIEARGVSIGMAHDLGLIHDERMCVVFPHHNAQGEVIDWWSARLVATTPAAPRGFAGLVPQKRIKMFCPPKEPPAAYLDPTLDWTQIEEGSTIYIHESVIKAINGAKCGFYSIGLNGVWGWGSKKHDIALLSQIKDLPWRAKKLQCVVVFDSNAATNDDVALAIRKFAERMRLICGVEVRHHLLPRGPEGQEWGFDDFCHHHGYEYATEWLANLEEAEPVNLSEFEMLRLQLNQEVVIVRSIKRVVEQQTGTMMGKGEFTDMNYAHYMAWMERGEAEVQVNVPKLWLNWPGRRSVERMEYTPGGELLVDGEYLNLWRGMGVEPARGDVSKWLELLERSVPDTELRKWVLQWFAYPLQNLGAKLNTYIHMYGPPGGGKGALLAPLLGIYGDNGIQLGRERIASDFNEVYATKQFINLDELHVGKNKDALDIGNKIKMLVTSEKLTVNGKGKGEYQVTNHVNMVTTSNYLDALKLDEGDRRCLVLRVGTPDTVIKDAAYWVPYFKWAKSVEGQAALYGYLLEVDLTGFEPQGWAPMTEEKEYVTDATRSPMEQWVHSLAEDPDSVLGRLLVGRRVFEASQLAQAYASADGTGGTQATPYMIKQMGQLLRMQGWTNRQVKVAGRNIRLWAIDHTYDNLPSPEWAKNYSTKGGKL